MKTIINFCAIWDFSGYKWAHGQRSSGNSKMPLLRTICCNFGRSSFQTHIIPFLVLFLHFFDLFYWLFTYFRCHNQKIERINWIPRLKASCWIFWGKKSLTKSNALDAWFEIMFWFFWRNHVIYFRFLPFSRHLRTSQENQNWSIQSRWISCNWGENFRLSQKERL